MIDFSSGDPKVFPQLAKVWDDAAKEVINNNIGALLAKYGDIYCNKKLLNEIIRLFTPYGIHLKPQNILFTNKLFILFETKKLS